MSALTTALTILISGLQQGAIFALLGIGLTIILGTMEFLNLAHGALYMLGAYLGLVVTQRIDLTNGWLLGIVPNPHAFGLGMEFTAAIVVVPVVMFFVGVLMERFVARPLYGRGEVDQLLITFGLAIIAQELIKQLFGPDPKASYAPSKLVGINVSQNVSIPLVGSFTTWRLIIIGLTIVTIAVTFLLIKRTDFGLVVQAGTRDSEMVRLLGIKISRSNMAVFGIGAALAGFAGLVGGTIISLNPLMGLDNALLPAFLTIVVAGAGSVVGAIVAGFILGIIFAGMQILAAQWSYIILFGFVAVILLTKPEGLFGSVEVGR